MRMPATPPSHTELQRLFCDGMRAPDTPPAALLEAMVDDGSALARFNVYRNNFVALNGAALADMYPTVRRLIGEEAFRSLAHVYVRLHPPRARTLLFYGGRFPGFLSGISELSRLPYLTDVAQLDYHWNAAYHAADADPLQPRAVASVDAQAFARCSLTLHPSVRLLRSDYPLYRIWSANQQDGGDETISLAEGTSRVVVFRSGMEVEVREVGEGSYVFLSRLQKGDTVGGACEAALHADGTFDLAAFFARNLFNGTFCTLVQPQS